MPKYPCVVVGEVRSPLNQETLSQKVVLVAVAPRLMQFLSLSHCRCSCGVCESLTSLLHARRAPVPQLDVPFPTLYPTPVQLRLTQQGSMCLLHRSAKHVHLLFRPPCVSPDIAPKRRSNQSMNGLRRKPQHLASGGMS